MKAPIAMSSNGGDDSQTKALKDSCLPPPVSDPNPAAQHPSIPASNSSIYPNPGLITPQGN